MARMFARALAAGVLVATQVDAVKIQASSEMNANSEMGSLTSANSEMSASALSEALGHMSAEAVQARISKYADQVDASRDELVISEDPQDESDLSFLAAHVYDPGFRSRPEASDVALRDTVAPHMDGSASV
mmetsp:Transcript_41032/g.93296  ORF Transcript_41032/g.93296 Transcript_41032/m.93296 type:complete len:131 (-) Transcript_41032:125-517(-)